ncbi:MAG: DUF503 domain-containing protein [Candidatus Nitrospinota bacterium M3_3B_026]
MVVGVLRVHLALRGNRSLKGKRQVVRSIKDRVKSRFNVSIAEVDGHDAHQRALLGISVVAVDAPHADSQLQQALRLVAERAEVLSADMELFNS